MRSLLALTLTAAATAVFTTTNATAAENPPLWQTISGCGSLVPTRTIQATPANYRSLIAGLLPGDRLQLAAGTYTQGLNLWDKNGEPNKCILVEGPTSGSPALFTNDPARNIVSFKNSSYLAVRYLSLDGGQTVYSDGVRGEATATSTHHILIDGLNFKNFNAAYNISAVNTKSPAWNWVVRNNTITSTGTGMYFGNSDGAGETTNFLVENNLVYDTLDYNIQFKHQLTRNTSIGMPSSGTTIIRNNTLSKENGSLSGDFARPNLLVGHWPTSGAGSTDSYQIYGNLLWQNPYEGLFQGEGNFSFHDNLLVNRSSDGAYSQPHNDVPKRIDFYNNTIVAAAAGISITGADPAYPQRVFGNAVFAGTPLTGGQQSDNVTGSYSAASTYLNNPMAALGAGLDLYPKTGQLQGTAIDYSAVSGLRDYDRDFNDRPRSATFRGAYSGSGVNPGWTPALAIKPPPTTTSNQLQNGVPISGLYGATGSQQLWTITVPSGASNLTIQTSGGTGDADPYLRFGSAPTTTTYDCGPVTGNNNEICSVPAPAPGTWYVLVDGYAAYSGMTLAASYQTSPACNSLSDVEPNDSRTAPQPISGICNRISGTFLNDATTQQNDYFRLNLPAGRTVTAQLYGLSADYDLEIYSAAGTKVAQSYHSDSNGEQASWTNTGSSAVDICIRVDRYTSARATYQLGVSY